MPPAPAIVPDAVSARGSDDERERHALGASNSDDESQTSSLGKSARAIHRLQGQTVWKNPNTVLKPDFRKPDGLATITSSARLRPGFSQATSRAAAIEHDARVLRRVGPLVIGDRSWSEHAGARAIRRIRGRETSDVA
jgi:hypothetical protein